MSVTCARSIARTVSSRSFQQCLWSNTSFQHQVQIQSRCLSFSFISRGLVSQNVKQSRKVQNNCPEERDINKDCPEIRPEHTKLVIREPKEARRKSPVVLLFGWGGASHKNLGKYADIYLNGGCTTVQYALPSSYVFRYTEHIPRLMDNILIQLEKVDIYNRQVYVHCLSDTGVMCYQGMMVSTKTRINVRGVVWDSCCGPRPEITVSRVAALLVVNWMCSLRDKMTMVESINSSYRLLVDRAWPGLLGKWKGEDVALSLIDGKKIQKRNIFDLMSKLGTWSGYWGRDHYKLHPSVSELFMYSNTDYYLPANYLEKTALAARDKDGVEYLAVKFTGSAHVAHLRKHKEEYTRHIRQFINVKTVTVRDEDLERKRKKKAFLESEQLTTSVTAP